MKNQRFRQIYRFISETIQDLGKNCNSRPAASAAQQPQIDLGYGQSQSVRVSRVSGRG